jgi:hypothetical protein
VPDPGKLPVPPRLFETAPPLDATALRTHEEIPRPFVLAPPPAGAREYPAGSEVVFELTLVGRAREFFPHFVVTLREVDRLGRGRRAVRLRRIDATYPIRRTTEPAYRAEDNLVRPADGGVTLADCAGVPVPAGGARVRFLTQTRLKHDSGFVRRPEFQVLFRRLLGRLSSLARFHCGVALEVDFRELIERAGAIRLVRDETRWTAWTRYSARQDRRMEWTGLVGCAAYEGDLVPFWPYLVFGQWVHVGKGATFGLGAYRIEPIDTDDGVAA